MGKELFDRISAFVGLVVLSPVLLIVGFLVYLQDGHSPLYIADRVGRNGARFRMVKIRSMKPNAIRFGATSTSGDDARITSIGRFIRRWKFDEMSQLWNVLNGDMSLVGPRPQILPEVETYTEEERQLLSIKPGITDFSSIIFADESEILRGASDPDLTYRQLIRPWKSRLGLFYNANATFSVDLRLIELTLLRIVLPRRALSGVCQLLSNLGAPEELVRIARRETALVPWPVPGKDKPFT